MRLSEEQVKEALLHGDPEVRFAALNYFAQAFSRNATVMPVAIEAFRRFGRADAFEFTFPIAELAQTSETIEWAIAELRQTVQGSDGESNFRNSVARLLCDADPEIVSPYEADLSEILGFHAWSGQKLARRLRAHAMDDDACWQAIEAICEKDKDIFSVHEAHYAEAKDLAETLARRGDRHAGRMMALLAEQVAEIEGNPMLWMEPLMIYMAGEMRYEPATELIIGKLRKDDEILNEECLYALSKIATDFVVRSVGEAFPSGEWAFRLFASSVLGRVHSDLAVETCSKLLLAEQDPEICTHLVVALADQFSIEGTELAIKALRDGVVDPIEFKESLLASCTLLGQDFAELAAWRRDSAQDRRRIKNVVRAMMSAALAEDVAEPTYRHDDAAPPSFPPSAPLRSQKGPGRNDPCPCGSGEKYKNCCLRKRSVL